jgi:hypothetical protein
MTTSADGVSTRKQKINEGSLAFVLSFEIVSNENRRGHAVRGVKMGCFVELIKEEVEGRNFLVVVIPSMTVVSPDSI